jgi:SAM-dependent methyltransferase
VLVDKFLDDREREAAIRTGGRPLVVADLESLPFRDGAFAYSICSHVLEHVDDAARAIAELERVSRGGYIETPTALVEILEPHRAYHKWMLSLRGGGLLFRRKDPENLERRRLLNRLVHGNAAFRLFIASNQRLKKTVVEWEGRIPHAFTDEPFHPDEYLEEARQSTAGTFQSLAAWAAARAARKWASLFGAFRKRFDLADLLRCPACRGVVRVGASEVTCEACGAAFAREGNVYRMSGGTENS